VTVDGTSPTRAGSTPCECPIKENDVPLKEFKNEERKETKTLVLFFSPKDNGEQSNSYSK
jgi:hypothetical protein